MFSAWEIIQIIITIFALGFIFSGHIKEPKTSFEELLSAYKSKFDWSNIKYAALITAPAIILHELAHKFTALSLNFDAVYHISYWGLGLGIILRLFSAGFIFFVPGYVAISGYGTHMQFAWVALAGPLANLTLFIASTIALKTHAQSKWIHAFALSKTINLWLFILNMIPIPGFDGFQVIQGIVRSF